MGLTLLEPPNTEPIDLSAARLQARKTSAEEDDLFTNVLIPACRDRAELATLRQLITARWQLNLDAWPCEGWIDVPRPPLQTILGITYVDMNGVTQTLAADQYIVDAPVGPRAPRGRVVPAYGVTWPTARAQANAIAVEFRCGYGDDGTEVPALLRQAMLRDIASLFEHREDVLVGTITAELPRSSASVYRSFKARPRQRWAA